MENIVTSGKNKTCTPQKQKWDQKISKKGYRIHKSSPLSAINFDRPHPEYESVFVKPKRSTFDPRPIEERTSSFKCWNELISMSDGNSSVLCFKNFTSNITSDDDYQLMPVSSPVLNPYTLPEIVVINNYNSENFYNYRTPEILAEIENLTTVLGNLQIVCGFHIDVESSLLLLHTLSCIFVKDLNQHLGP